MQAPAAIAVFSGTNRVFSFANELYRKWFSRTEQQLIGKSFKQVFPDFGEQKMQQLLDEAWSTGTRQTAYECPSTSMASDGEGKTSYHNFIIQPVKNRKEIVEDVMIHIYDVTDHVMAGKK
jgi:PAS domain S-box-containing protein